MQRIWWVLRQLPRLLLVGVLGAQALALFVGGLAPPVEATRRALRKVQPLMLSGYMLEQNERLPYLVDPDTGDTRRIGLPAEDSMEMASCSPWQDEHGGCQAVGRWMRLGEKGQGALGQEFGLVRCALPSGKVLDRIETDVLPATPPTWYPGSNARVLFAACNGSLYHFNFEPPASSAGGGAKNAPQEIAWRVVEGAERPWEFGEMIWPEDKRLGGRLIASLAMPQAGPNGKVYVGERQLWWLQLDAAGTTVVSAQRLTVPDEFDRLGTRIEERCPTLAVGDDGSLVLAYLVRSAPVRTARWHLRVAKIEVNSGTGIPRLRQEASETLLEDCMAVTPAFGSDGRKLTCITVVGDVTPRVSHVAMKSAAKPTGHQAALLLAMSSLP